MTGERLLIVDDETALLHLLERYLARMGYQVDLASSAEDALARFTQNPSQYSCVLTDLTLPGMNGEELVQQLRRLRPGLPALISSGYPYQPTAPATAFLQKPYLPAMLAGELDRLLRKSAKSTAERA